VDRHELRKVMNMGRTKYWNGTQWVEVAPSAQEFDEHQANDAAHGIGDKNDLSTVHKSTLVGAINEAFTSANNGKDLLKPTIIGKGGKVQQVGGVPTYAELNDGILSIPTGVKFKKVVEGNASISSTEQEIYVTIPTVDLSKAVVICQLVGNFSGNATRTEIIGTFYDDHRLHFERGEASGNGTVYYQVIEFENAKIQSLTMTQANGTTTTQSTINAVDRTKSFVICSYRMVSTNQYPVAVRPIFYFSSDTQIVMFRARGDYWTDAHAFIIEGI
jgi:hypothetical protein